MKNQCAGMILLLTLGVGGLQAQQPTYYYNGKHKVNATIITSALSVETTAPLTPALAARHALAVQADTGEIGFSLVRTRTTDLKELNDKATAVRGDLPGARVGLVLQIGKDPDQSRNEVLTDEISFRVLPDQTADSIAKRYGLTDVRSVPYAADIFIAKVPATQRDLLSPITTANRMYEDKTVQWATPLVLKKRDLRLIPNDPSFPNQWHLNNTSGNTTYGLSGNDINVIPAWDLATGGGINISIVDSGVDVLHPDLMANVRDDIDYDFNNNDTDPTPTKLSNDTAGHYHGTAVAGLAAAKGNNSLGITGSAPNAGIVGLRVLAAAITDATEATALSWHSNDANPANVVHISNNSWGPPDNGATFEMPGPLAEAALESSALTGRGGKGTIFVWAGGNGRSNLDNMNRDGYANNPYVITVASTDSRGESTWYSDPGAAIMVNAPSNGNGDGQFTTDIAGNTGKNTTDYMSDFGGTSGSSPIVAGVVALMLEINPNLTYRDVMHILINTAQKNHPASPTWLTNAAGVDYSHNYGFGRVDAAAAVVTAQTWTNMPAVATPIEVTANIPTPVAIPDNDANGTSFSIEAVTPANFKLEHVELETDITHEFRGDLDIQLRSPNGTWCVLAENNNDTNDDISHTFRSLVSWGEPGNGTWQVNVADRYLVYTGTVNSLKLKLRGYIGNHASAENWELY